MANSDIKQIADITLTKYNEFEGLTNFFNEVSKSECDYVVAMAPRCFVLQNIFNQTGSKHNTRIISNNALLLYADKFVEKYVLYDHKFPTVLVIDDILWYGVAILQWLERFEKLIRREIMRLRMVDKLSDDDKFYIHRDFMDAIKVYAYISPIAQQQTDKLYERCVSKRTERYINEVNDFEQHISEFIQEVSEPTASYHLSLQIPTKTLRSLVEDLQFNCSFECSYRGMTRRIYSLGDYSDGRFVPFVYTHGEECFNSNEQTWITGISMLGDIKSADFDEICKTTIRILNESCEGQEKQKYKFVTKLLEKKEKEIQGQRAQFISYILSVINVHDFLRKIGFNIANAKTEDNLKQIRCISNNFGMRSDLKDCFSIIAFDVGLVAELKNALYPYFKNCPSELASKNITPISSEKGESYKIINWIEEVFQQVGMEAVKEGYDICNYKKRFEPEKLSADVITISTCLDKMNGNAPKLEKNTVSLYSKLAHLIALVDSGLATFDFVYNPDRETIAYSLNISHLSVFYILRKIHCFIPALTHIEKTYYGTGYTAKELVKKFIEHLSCYKPNGGEYEKYSIDVENEARQCLMQCGQNLADLLYDAGLSFRCFDSKLLIYGDWRDENRVKNDLSYFTFLMRNNTRPRLYVKEAKKFMNNF